MLVDGSTVACFVTTNVLVRKGVVLIRTLLVSPRGTCVLLSCFVDPIPAVGLGLNPLTVSVPLFSSMRFVFSADAQQGKYSDFPAIDSVS